MLNPEESALFTTRQADSSVPILIAACKSLDSEALDNTGKIF